MTTQPTAANNFLLSHNYIPPATKNPHPKILYIHSTRMERSQPTLARLRSLLPEGRFHILKQSKISFPELNLDDAVIFDYTEPFLSPDFQLTHRSGEALADFDLVFFSVNIPLGPSMGLVEFKEGYVNLCRFIENLGLKERTHIIDETLKVHPFTHFDIDSWTRIWNVQGNPLRLPWTLVSQNEKDALYELARSGPGEGEIVNIGYFLGGTSIIMARASKERGREKVHAFDVKQHEDRENLLQANGVEDWISLSIKDSRQAAIDWGKRSDTRIRLLLVDGDHSYEGCKQDILSWVPYLVPGGILAVHDYCNVSEGVDFSSIVRAVYDTVLLKSDFEDYRQTDTLFLATKK